MEMDFREKNLKDWEDLLLALFNGTIPDYCSWENTSEIIRILNSIGENPNLNQMFFPTGGGLDLAGAGNSVEGGCIEMYFHEKSAYIAKPKALIFQSFGHLFEWAYFRLDTNNLEPSGVYENSDRQKEELTELAPGDYVERSYWDQGHYGRDEYGNEQALPDSARLITRFFSGSFVIFAKGSAYNADTSTYDGRHSKMTTEQFKQYIGDNVKKIRDRGRIL